ncbi:MAG: NUDIX domain-containing protein [Candidatus Nanohaloarchaea archaeon]
MREAAIAVARCEERGYLIVRRAEHETNPGRWEFAGGEVEDGERPEDAARRELEEETGLEGEIVREGDHFVGQGTTGKWRLHPFLVEVDGREVELSREHDEHRWIRLSELENLDTVGRMKAVEKLELAGDG